MVTEVEDELMMQEMQDDLDRESTIGLEKDKNDPDISPQKLENLRFLFNQLSVDIPANEAQ